MKWLDNLYNRRLLARHGVECKAPPTIHGRLMISHFAGPGRFKLGENVVICSSVESNPVSGNRTIFLIKGDGALIEIGDNTGMSNVVICAMERVSIGSWVNLGAGCRIFDTDFHSVDLGQRIANTNIPHKPVRIEDGAFIRFKRAYNEGRDRGRKRCRWRSCSGDTGYSRR